MLAQPIAKQQDPGDFGAAGGENVKVDLSALGIKGKVVVRDLWKKQNVGTCNGAYAQLINKYGAALLKMNEI